MVKTTLKASFSCPRCEAAQSAALAPGDETLVCGACRFERDFAALDPGAPLTHCLACGGDDLYVRKDFPQKLGIAIVAAGFLLSSIAWFYYLIYWAFGILFFFAAIDLALWLSMGECLVCYRCHAQFRGWSTAGAAPFHLETFERYRQVAARTQAAADRHGS